MSRSTERMDITFLRSRDRLLLLLQSQKWTLERGKAYTVHLMTDSRSIEPKALAESTVVTIELADRSFNQSLGTADVLEVRGEGAKLQVPFRRGDSRAPERMFEQERQSVDETNPFVSPLNHPKRRERSGRGSALLGSLFLPMNAESDLGEHEAWIRGKSRACVFGVWHNFV
jgi:hypothetical protein